MMGQQSLVGCDQMLAVGKGGLGECSCGAFRPANQLDHDIDSRVGGELPGIVAPVETAE